MLTSEVTHTRDESGFRTPDADVLAPISVMRIVEPSSYLTPSNSKYRLPVTSAKSKKIGNKIFSYCMVGIVVGIVVVVD